MAAAGGTSPTTVAARVFRQHGASMNSGVLGGSGYADRE
jgi:hypothetical protein